MVAGFTLGERARVIVEGRRRADWSRVVYDLSRAGFGPAMVAKAVGRTTGWVDYLRNSPGARPKHDEGELLLQLWALYTGKSAAEAPRERGMSGISARGA